MTVSSLNICGCQPDGGDDLQAGLAWIDRSDVGATPAIHHGEGPVRKPVPLIQVSADGQILVSGGTFICSNYAPYVGMGVLICGLQQICSE